MNLRQFIYSPLAISTKKGEALKKNYRQKPLDFSGCHHPGEAALPLIAWVRTPSPGKTAETARDSAEGEGARDETAIRLRLGPSHEKLLPPSAAAAQRKARAGAAPRPAPRSGPGPQRAPSHGTASQDVGEGLFPKKYLVVVVVGFGIL